MNLIHVGAAILNQTPMDWDGNARNIVAAIRDAKSRGVSLLCLPELCICGYGCEDWFFSPSLRRTSRDILREILPETEDIAVSLGLPVLHEGSLYNTCAFAVDGRVAGLVAKQHLAGDGLHCEPRWFKPWPNGRSEPISFDGVDVPFGDILFDLNGIRVGFEICEDAWVADRPALSLASRNVDIILNPSASHFAFGKSATRRQLVAESSRAFNATYVYANMIGNEAGRAIYDGGALIASSGNIVGSGKRFTYQLHDICDAVIDVDATRTRRAQVASKTSNLQQQPTVVRVNYEWPTATAPSTPSTSPKWECSEYAKEEEFTRAICLALFDYARKSHSKGFVVSLSGGADSTAVACLVRLMVDLGISDIGLNEFCQRIGISQPSGAAIENPDAVMQAILTTIYQATQNSSTTTREAAARIANAINAKHLEFDVDEICQKYVGVVEESLGRQLQWERDDIALQNIQARVRAPGAWLIANLSNALLLATSNRSEAAVGYATMDGDTCGGISPIAGIDKAFLRQWLVWLEQTGPEGRGPIPELECVNKLQPTAELRPLDQNQTDEDDLMPYEVLDAIEDEAIGQKRSPSQALISLKSKFPHYAESDLAAWTKRFFSLWCRNQWKRERYAPSFHVDDKYLDPKTWCRFPILSGGFQRELQKLAKTDSQ